MNVYIVLLILISSSAFNIAIYVVVFTTPFEWNNSDFSSQFWPTIRTLFLSVWYQIAQRTNYYSYARSSSFCEGRTSFSLGLISRKFYGFLLRLALLHSMSYLFFLYRSPSSWSTIFDSVSSNIDEVLAINLSTNLFDFGDLNVYYKKHWLTYSDGTDGTGAFAVIFLAQMTLLRWLTFLLRSLTVTLRVCSFGFTHMRRYL